MNNTTNRYFCMNNSDDEFWDICNIYTHIVTYLHFLYDCLYDFDIYL